MTKQTYSTRHLTARDHQLLDALAASPRYRKIAERLRPPAPAKPKAKRGRAKTVEPDENQDDDLDFGAADDDESV